MGTQPDTHVIVMGGQSNMSVEVQARERTDPQRYVLSESMPQNLFFYDDMGGMGGMEVWAPHSKTEGGAYLFPCALTPIRATGAVHNSIYVASLSMRIAVKYAKQNPGVRVVAIQVSKSGTGYSHWITTGIPAFGLLPARRPLLNDAIAAVQRAMTRGRYQPSQLKALFWHQGEMPSIVPQGSLHRLVFNRFKALNPTIVCVSGGVNTNYTGDDVTVGIRKRSNEQNEQVVKEAGGFWVNTEDMVTHDTHFVNASSDIHHFTRASKEAIAKAYVAAYMHRKDAKAVMHGDPALHGEEGTPPPLPVSGMTQPLAPNCGCVQVAKPDGGFYGGRYNTCAPIDPVTNMYPLCTHGAGANTSSSTSTNTSEPSFWGRTFAQWAAFFGWG
jgi:hypothetical protein